MKSSVFNIFQKQNTKLKPGNVKEKIHQNQEKLNVTVSGAKVLFVVLIKCREIK